MRVVSFSSQIIHTGVTLWLTAGASDTLAICRMLIGFQGAVASCSNNFNAQSASSLLRPNISQTFAACFICSGTDNYGSVIRRLDAPYEFDSVHYVITGFPSFSAAFLCIVFIFMILLFN
ncbi:hypothetical protein L208DRAFT_656714 [Tricholoma matsutake]|nr:hypothetical protein L208DRAFT_656714 [Tricholoma matsutake 945]